MIDKIKKLEPKLKSKFYYNFEMEKLTWFRAGGKAKILAIVEDSKELDIILNSKDDLKFYIIGAGSNLLVRDKGFNGILIKLGKGFNKIEINQNKLIVGASILDVNLSNFAKRNRISGFEFYIGIPGTIGGAIKMNAGCFGSQTSDILNNVNVTNNSGENKNIKINELNMAYRSSSILDTNVITSAEFNVNYGNIKEIEEKIEYIKNQRQKKQPIKEKTSGSTFKNPSNNFAARLIEESDCKGLTVGDAAVSNHHCNFLINKGNATAKNLEDLGKKIIEKVFNKFDIKLEWEIKIIGN